MKKIVALVLCLVLALSLATVAFGATLEGTTTSVSGTDWKIEKAKDANADKGYGVRYDLLTKVDGKWKDAASDLVETDSKSAQYKFIDGTKIVYLREETQYTEEVTVLKTVKYAAADACGELFTFNDATVYEGDDAYYVSTAATGTNDTFVYVGGKTIAVTPVQAMFWSLDQLEDFIDANYDPAVYFGTNDLLNIIVHQIDVTTEENSIGALTVQSVKCDDCKASLEFKTSLDSAINAFGYGNYHNYGAGADSVAAGGYYVSEELDNWDKALYVKNVKVSSAATTETVESAKTFDAGIALYAGMALASVAGSAVVIGKKKEF